MIKFFYQNNDKSIIYKLYEHFKNDLWINGNIVKIFEKNFSRRYGKSLYASGCNSGTDALKLALFLDKKKGKDIYITTPFSYIATASAVKSLGFNLIYIDVCKNNFLLDIDKLEVFLKSCPKLLKKRIRGVIFAEIFGYTTNLLKLKKITREHKISLIGDCAQSLGVKYSNLPNFHYYDYSCVSFYPTKILSAYGDGGILVVKKRLDYENTLILKNNGHGTKDKSNCLAIGLNSRLDSLQAYILNIKIKSINYVIKLKGNVNYIFNKVVSKYCVLPTFHKKISPNNYIFSFYIDPKLRNTFIKFMKNSGVQCNFFYNKLLSDNFLLKPIYKTNLPNAIYCAKSLVCLPNDIFLDKIQIQKICNLINLFFSRYTKKN